MADSVRTLRVELIGTTEQFRKAFGDAATSVNKLGESTTGLGGKLEAAFKSLTSGGGISGALTAIGPAGLAAAAGVGAIGAAVGIAAHAMESLAGQAEQWTNQAKSTGLGVETVQQLRAMLEDAGIGSESLSKAMKALHAEIASGGDSLKKYGIDLGSIKDLAPEEQLQAVAQALLNISDVNERGAAAVAAFGKAGEDLIPVLDQIAEGGYKTIDALGEKQVAALKHVDDELDKAGRSWTSFKNSFLAGVAGIINALDEFDDRTTGRIRNVTESLAHFEKRMAAIKPDMSELTLGPETPAQKAAVAAYQEGQREIQEELKKSAAEAERTAAKFRALVDDLDRAFAEAGARGMTGLEGAFAKVDADAMKWSQKLAELVKNGLDPESAAAFREEIDRLAVSLRANALEAERQKVLGKTFSDVALEAKNLQQVLSTVSLKSLTPDALTALEVTLTKLVELGQPFVAQLAAVRDRMREIGATTPEQARQLQLNLQLVDQMAQSEQHVAELRQAANDQQARQFGELSQTLSSYRDLVDTVGASFVALGRISQESLDGISTAFASASRQAQAFAEVASTGALSAASALDLARQSFAGGAGAQSFLGGLAQGVAGGSPLLGVIGFFAGNRSRQQMRDVGRTWGVAISDELAKQIEKDAKRLGSSVAAQLVNLPKIIEEAGGIGTFGVDKAIGALGDLMAQMKAGKVSVAEAGKVFDEVFGELAPKAIDKTTGLASKAFADLIQKAKAAGIESQAMTQFLADQTTKLGTALEAVAKGAIITAKSAAGVGAAVVAEFEQLRASGMSAKDALDQIQPTIDALRDKLAEIGVSGGAAFDQLAAESALLHDEVGGPLMEAILGASDAIVALANSGALTQETFGGLTAAIGDTYAKLQEEGKSGPAALALMQPSLQAMWEAEQRFGYTADASTQALIDQAVATGQVGEAHKSATERMVDATQRVADILEAVARKMGVEIPEAAQKGAQGIQDAFGGVSVDIPVNYTGGELPGMPGVPAAGVPSFASGGIGDFGSGALAILHGPEAIVPLTGGGSPTAGGILGGTTINQFVSFDENPLQTFEGLRLQREFTVRAMQREAGRNLPALVAAGRA